MRWLCVIPLVSLFTPSVVCLMPPVENVSVVCHNLQTVVYWNHSRPDLNPHFTVLLSRYQQNEEVVCSQSPISHCNVSAAVRGIIREDYKVTVTAVGQNESQPVPFVVFSYDKDSLARQICSVDLPPVNLSVQSDRMTVYFNHPFNVYKQAISQSEWDDYMEFEYTVITKDQGKDPEKFFCEIEDGVCKAEVPGELTAGRHCVSIVGYMEALKVSSTNDICGTRPPDTSNHIVLYALVVSMIVMVMGCVLLVIIRIWATRSSPLPKSIVSTWLPNVMTGSPLRPERTTTCAVDISGNAPLIQTPETTSGDTPTSLTPLEPELRLPIGLQTEAGDDGDVTSSPPDSSGYSKEEGETSVCEYEKRPSHLLVYEEIEPGDMLEGYRTSDLGCSG